MCIWRSVNESPLFFSKKRSHVSTLANRVVVYYGGNLLGNICLVKSQAGISERNTIFNTLHKVNSNTLCNQNCRAELIFNRTKYHLTDCKMFIFKLMYVVSFCLNQGSWMNLYYMYLPASAINCTPIPIYVPIFHTSKQFVFVMINPDHFYPKYQ